MKVKIFEIVNARPVFEKLVKLELPFHTVRAVGKVVKVVSEELTLVEQKRVELVKKYGVADEKQNITVAPENMENFTKEYNEILNTEVDFENGLTVKHLENPIVNLSTQEYFSIEKFIVE